MALKNIYASEALKQIPHLLSIMDRNRGSPTYGCFYRPYWHDKATDIPSAHPQISVLPLALVHSYKFPGSIFYKKEKIREWCEAGMIFWSSIQKNDGSFDEHYPNEHSFGAAAWTLFAIIESYKILSDEFDNAAKEKIYSSMLKAGKFLAKSDEPGKITNHQIIAAYCLHQLNKLSGSEDFLKASEKKINITLDRQSEEGWFKEYDGCDFGYLTTTISFLAKYYMETKAKNIYDSLAKAIEFSSYFVYPNGSYGGIIGSRHTSHFHPHGYELIGKKIPLASSISDKILFGIKNGFGLVPSAMDEKYLPNLIIEYLLSYIDFSERKMRVKLPCETKPFNRYFSDSGIFVSNSRYYFVANLKKGGVFQIFHGRKSYTDAGILALSDDKKAVSTQWLDDNYKINIKGKTLEVAGNFHYVPFEYLSSKKMVFSRAYLSLVGKRGSFYTKKHLINRLITKSRMHRAKFRRLINLESNSVIVKDDIDSSSIRDASIESVFIPRYVPASRYFQKHELDSYSLKIDLKSSPSITRVINTDTMSVKH